MRDAFSAEFVATGRRCFKPYPAYKDSGVEWLGEIPAHWKVAPVYARYEVALGKMLDAKRVTGQFPGRYLRNVDVQWDNVNTEGLPEMDFAPSERDRYLLRSGDLLVCEGGEVGRTAMWRGGLEECFYQKAIHRVRPRLDQEVPRFFYYLMCSLAKRGVFVAGGNPNTIDHLTAVQLRHYRFPFPPASEQRVIAAFLDRETAKIDALVAKKERLIELLQEKRAALITRAVTKGLDPNVPMKDSGVEWLGEIPAHWKIRQLRRVVRKFVDYRGATPEKGASGIPLVTAANIKNGRINFNETAHFIPEEDYREWMVRGLPERGDVLLTTEAPLGETAQIEDPMLALAQRLILLKADSGCVINEFLKYHFAAGSGRAELWTKATGSTAIGIKAYHLKATLIAVPPIAEQRSISEHLDEQTVEIDALITKIREGIEKLKEYRTALISAAVTGKIDVRGSAVLNLPPK